MGVKSLLPPRCPCTARTPTNTQKRKGVRKTASWSPSPPPPPRPPPPLSPRPPLSSLSTFRGGGEEEEAETREPFSLPSFNFFLREKVCVKEEGGVEGPVFHLDVKKKRKREMVEIGGGASRARLAKMQAEPYGKYPYFPYGSAMYPTRRARLGAEEKDIGLTPSCFFFQCLKCFSEKEIIQRKSHSICEVCRYFSWFLFRIFFCLLVFQA